MWCMGHSGYDIVHRRPPKMKMHWQNQLKSLVLVYFIVLELDTKRLMLDLSNAPLIVLYAAINQHLQLVKSSPMFTFSSKSLVKIHQQFTSFPKQLGKDSPPQK